MLFRLFFFSFSFSAWFVYYCDDGETDRKITSVDENSDKLEMKTTNNVNNIERMNVSMFWVLWLCAALYIFIYEGIRVRKCYSKWKSRVTIQFTKPINYIRLR